MNRFNEKRDKKRIWDMIEGTRAPNKDAWLLERIAEIKKKAGPKCNVPSLSDARANHGAPYSADGLRYCHASYPNREWYSDCPYCGRHAYVD